jgi:hypothetical protein
LKIFIILQKVPGFANKTLLPEINSSDIDAETTIFQFFWHWKLNDSVQKMEFHKKYIQICPEGY